MVIVLLMALNKIRMLLSIAKERLAAMEKREGGGGVPAKKQSKMASKLPKGRTGKSVKKK